MISLVNYYKNIRIVELLKSKRKISKMNIIFYLSILTVCAYSANASTRESRASISPRDFIFDLDASTGSTNTGGTVQPADEETWPSLISEGLAFSLFRLRPCGMNQPHNHPRASEIQYVIKGSNVTVSFVEENGGRVITNVIDTGKVSLFPQGLIHFQQNLGCEEAILLSALNAENPGVLTISPQLALFPRAPIATHFGLSVGRANSLFFGVNRNQAPLGGTQECIDRCAALLKTN
jgi:oxalate decarboxylase/phosphoglucose isomerase-like protein (cupin superfamily)